MSTESFPRKFEKGAIGDEKYFFDWYAFNKLLSSWTKTKKAIQPLIANQFTTKSSWILLSSPTPTGH